jgi:hypothetical protein
MGCRRRVQRWGGPPLEGYQQGILGVLEGSEHPIKCSIHVGFKKLPQRVPSFFTTEPAC